MRQCTAGVPLPTALRQCGSAKQEFHCPQPQAAWQCVTLPTALCPQQQCSRAHTVQCSAQHQAVRRHTESTDGAARHARCSGPMRPCETAHRRRQGSVGQVRECTGPAMQQHTYTQRAHNTHSPARLPVPVGRHPGHCLLVTAPSAQRNTTQHNTTQHNTTQHNTTQHNTTQHNTTQHNTTQHNTTQHNTTQHNTTQHNTTRELCRSEDWMLCRAHAACKKHARPSTR